MKWARECGCSECWFPWKVQSVPEDTNPNIVWNPPPKKNKKIKCYTLSLWSGKTHLNTWLLKKKTDERKGNKQPFHSWHQWAPWNYPRTHTTQSAATQWKSQELCGWKSPNVSVARFRWWFQEKPRENQLIIEHVVTCFQWPCIAFDGNVAPPMYLIRRRLERAGVSHFLFR